MPRGGVGKRFRAVTDALAGVQEKQAAADDGECEKTDAAVKEAGAAFGRGHLLIEVTSPAWRSEQS